MQSPNGLGSLELQGDVADLVVTSRTYTADARGTFGQFIAGESTDQAIGGATSAHVTHMRNDADFRSNIGFTEVAGEGGIVRVAGVDVPVAPFQHWQMPAPGSGDLLVSFRVIGGKARILGYGSSIDNRSGDAIYVPARVATEVPRTEYAPVISAAGALGTQWSTEVVFRQVAGAAAPFEVSFGAASALVTTPARFTNILTELFHQNGTKGLLRTTVPLGARATARIFTQSTGGTFGQFVPFLPAGTFGGQLIQIESSADFRTNLGAANPGADPVRAVFNLFDADGAELAIIERTVQPLELVQFPLPVNAARVRVDGNVLAYASVVDNRSGDAIYVPAR
jgi:hypothetical protein